MIRAFVQANDKTFYYLPGNKFKVVETMEVFEFLNRGQWYSGNANQICALSFSSRMLLGTAPTCLSTISPFLMNRTVGIFRMPYFTVISGFSSTFTFPMIALPSYSFASSSTMGAIARHGPHHSAQKSINVTFGDFRTSIS